MKVLGIETSCDETSCAIVEGRKILGMCVLTQDAHSVFGGVVPEIASRAHLKTLVPVLERALKEAGIGISDIDAIAVTEGPGLPGSLFVGINFAKGLVQALGVPLISVNHVEAHLVSPFLEFEDFDFPYLGLVVSGGHTSLYFAESLGRYKLLARTLDDAAGEVLDKSAKFLRLGYPGGPILDRMAKGVEQIIKFPKVSSNDFSFSGLKTAFINALRRWAGGIPIYEFVSSFQEAVIQQLLRKVEENLEGVSKIAVVGGVARNSRLREVFAKLKVKVYIPSGALCIDNGAMVAFLGSLYLEMGMTSHFDIEPKPTGLLKAKGGI